MMGALRHGLISTIVLVGLLVVMAPACTDEKECCNCWCEYTYRTGGGGTMHGMVLKTCRLSKVEEYCEDLIWEEEWRNADCFNCSCSEQELDVCRE